MGGWWGQTDEENFKDVSENFEICSLQLVKDQFLIHDWRNQNNVLSEVCLPLGNKEPSKELSHSFRHSQETALWCGHLHSWGSIGKGCWGLVGAMPKRDQVNPVCGPVQCGNPASWKTTTTGLERYQWVHIVWQRNFKWPPEIQINLCR